MSHTLVDALIHSGQAISKNLAAGQSLFCLGDRCENFVIVRKGTVRVELLSTSGQQMLLYRIEDGQSCVMTTSCLLGSSRYFAQAFSETSIELVVLSQATFNEQLRASSEFRDFVFNGFHQRFAELINRTTELVTSTVDQRLAAALLTHAQISASNTTVEQTHQQLAIDIGTAREVVSRRLATFEKNGLIEKNRGQLIILDIDKLKDLLSD